MHNHVSPQTFPGTRRCLQFTRDYNLTCEEHSGRGGYRTNKSCEGEEAAVTFLGL